MIDFYRLQKKSSSRQIRRRRTKIGLKFQLRHKNINLDNKTRFSYPEAYFVLMVLQYVGL
jgi:hypothetical protein